MIQWHSTETCVQKVLEGREGRGGKGRRGEGREGEGGKGRRGEGRGGEGREGEERGQWQKHERRRKGGVRGKYKSKDGKVIESAFTEARAGGLSPKACLFTTRTP